MIDPVPPLLASFPWLTDKEALAVAELLPRGADSSAASEQMRSIAATLEEAGLPPTSTLLLALAGRGSKATAVEIARVTARSRFEAAKGAAGRSVHPSVAQPAIAAALDDSSIRQIVQATVQATMAMSPAAFASDALGDRVFRAIDSLAGDVSWLKSTIDTERQLRRYRETHGPLPEHQVSQAPSSPQVRRQLVQHLASSLERDRFSSDAGGIDSADGREE